MLKNREGEKVPSTQFNTRKEHQWVELSSDDIFANRRVVLFSLPGAFTPTCSSTHLPRYNQLAPVMKEQGIDEVICLSVNDAFVMQQWQREQDATNITFMPDGNGDFTRGMGMLVPKQAIGFGDRSWRYSMLVDNGVIEKMFIEPDLPGDPFEVSDADTMLNYLAPETAVPADVTLFARDGCEFCVQAKTLLQDVGMNYEELVLNRNFSEATLRAVSGRSTVPQVFINGEHIGGAEDLQAYFDKAVAA
ncbi:MAG: glutaredoxin-like protein [Planctomycetota bacterium]|jgi:glutaredoxin-like protein